MLPSHLAGDGLEQGTRLSPLLQHPRKKSSLRFFAKIPVSNYTTGSWNLHLSPALQILPENGSPDSGIGFPLSYFVARKKKPKKVAPMKLLGATRRAFRLPSFPKGPGGK